MSKPTDEQRLAAGKRPNGPALMYQSWNDLLFLHWTVEANTIQKMLPKGLFVDSFQGSAFVGVVPFFMKNIRFRGTPAVPWVSNFLELNLRTYVFDQTGRPGVWFFSLDCNQPLAVWAARALFHLPYQHASMRARFSDRSSIEATSIRRSQRKTNKLSRFDYSYGSDRSSALQDSLEFFLVERYFLFASNRKGIILSGQVHHKPYPLCDVEVRGFETDLFQLNDLPFAMRPFDHAVGSRGVDVEVFPLRREPF